MSNSDLLIMLIPVIILQFTLMVVSLVHILRHDTYKVGTRLIWILVVIFINFLGPILYFAIGREE